MPVKNSVQAIPLTSIASSTITTSFQPINTTGLPYACFMISIINEATTDVTISYDGVTAHDYVLAGTVRTLSFQTNSQPNTNIAKLSAGTQIYVKGTAGTGSVYLAGYYQAQL